VQYPFEVGRERKRKERGGGGAPRYTCLFTRGAIEAADNEAQLQALRHTKGRTERGETEKRKAKAMLARDGLVDLSRLFS